MSRHECPECGYVYDSQLGDRYTGYPPGTSFAELPDDYNCPQCCVRDKPDFIALDESQATGQSTAIAAKAPTHQWAT